MTKLFALANTFFQFKQFMVHHERCAMKVTTDSCLFGAWVATELHRLMPPPVRLLDIGTGTGLLSLMAAQANKGFIDAVEIDKAATKQAEDNIEASPWKERINILHQDVLKWQTATKWDCIFSNPPFYQDDLKSFKTTKNLAHHDEGLKFSDLLFFIKNHLTESGTFFLLLPAKRENELAPLLADNGLFLHQKVLVQQTPQHQPFRLLIKGGNQKGSGITESVIVIKNDADDYTQDVASLLKDYYLYL